LQTKLPAGEKEKAEAKERAGGLGQRRVLIRFSAGISKTNTRKGGI